MQRVNINQYLRSHHSSALRSSVFMHAKWQGIGVQDNQLSSVYYDGTTDYRPTHVPFASSVNEYHRPCATFPT